MKAESKLQESKSFDSHNVWAKLESDKNMLMNGESLLEESRRDAILHMEVAVDQYDPEVLSEVNDDDWGLSDDEEYDGRSEIDRPMKKRRKSFDTEDSYESHRSEQPRTPSPVGRNAIFVTQAQVITPDQIPVPLNPLSCRIHRLSELQIAYQQALQRFAKSMSRSDETRSILKRRHETHSWIRPNMAPWVSHGTTGRTNCSGHNTGFLFQQNLGSAHDRHDAALHYVRRNFFASEQCRELEDSRQRVSYAFSQGMLGMHHC